MRQMVIVAIATLLSCDAGFAQSVITTPGLGATSPLGTLGSMSPSASSPSGSFTGIPLGATAIDPGGLSPATNSITSPMSSNSSCVATGVTAGMGSGTGTSSTFDGGGLTAGACPTTSASVSSAGTASPLSSPGATATLQLNGGTIPLGSTEINSAGVGGLIGIPATHHHRHAVWQFADVGHTWDVNRSSA